MSLNPATELANVSSLDAGGTAPRRGDASVRPYPFPYRAALAISNDIDYMRADAFEDFHAFVCGSAPTRYGDGLGLEVANSMWIWASNQARSAISLSYQLPEEVPYRLSAVTPRLRELGQLGWLDTLHSLGNFSRSTGLRHDLGRREQAAYALELLDRLNIRPTVYVNHSQSPSNVGGPWGYYQKADDPTHPMYCLDLLRAFGLRFYWIDPCVNVGKFGDHLNYAGAKELHEAIARFEWASWTRRRTASRSVTSADLAADQEERRRQFASFFNRTLFEVTARDQNRLLAFKRHRGSEQPLQTTFAYQVQSEQLDQLETRHGAIIVYQHFGRNGPRGRAPLISKPLRTSPPPPALDEHSVACFEDIAERQRDGRLFVAATGRLLNYLWMRDRLVYSCSKHSERWHIEIEGLNCSAEGNKSPGDVDLNGLAFLVPQDAPDVVVTCSDRVAPLAVDRHPDPVYPGYHAISSAWTRLEWPSRRRVSLRNRYEVLKLSLTMPAKC